MSPLSQRTLRSVRSRSTVFLSTFLFLTALARASGPVAVYPVTYSPLNSPAGIFDAVPANVATSYTVDVTSPANFPANTSFSPTGSSISIAVTTGAASAASYVSVVLDPNTSQPSAYTAPNQTLRFRVTGTFPLVTVSTTYAYTLKIVGWPGIDPAALSNLGHFISATSVPPPPVTADPPQIQITTPGKGSTFVGSGASITIPFSFNVVATDQHPISSVGATITGPGFGSGTPITLGVTGLGTGSVVAVADLTIANPGGQYSIVATGANDVATVTDTTNFTVTFSGLPPTVVINNPAPGSAWTLNSLGMVEVPFDFLANSPSGTLASLKVILDGKDVSTGISYANYSGVGYATGVGSLPLDYTAAGVGTHTITVTASNAFGSATATTNFIVQGTVAITATLKGTVFFDANYNGSQQSPDEPGLPGLTVRLLNATNQASTTTMTNAAGGYSFLGLAAGQYYVSVVSTIPAGLSLTTPAPVSVLVDSAGNVTSGGLPVTSVDIGYGLKFSAIKNLSAGGFTIGYWKNNVEKALAGKTGGVQVSADNVAKYSTTITNGLALDVFEFGGPINLAEIYLDGFMSSTSSAPVDLLKKQLVASEYNYSSGVDTPGAYIGGSELLTRCFITWGEYVVKNRATDSAYVIFAQQWFDAYNNSHGGLVSGPLP